MHGPDRSTRREVLALGVGALVVAAIPLTRGRRAPVTVRRRAPVMGTLADLVVVHPDRATAEAAADDALAALRFVDRTMTRFNSDSDIGRTNRLALQDAVPVDPATAHVLEQALVFAERTGGAFDPCLAGAVTLWNVNERSAPPAADDSRMYAGRRLYRALDVGTHRGRAAVRIHDPNAQVDLGGIAKGYGVDAAAEALRRHGIRHALVNVGGDLV
ncbi:MAG: FAD:protein FMN transferase, partial [Planctomycetota bacterium]|nr:FAD:protein FMN transferase [Planctomycetota bacterium]